MPVAPGTRFGPYEVVAKLGEGGMGEVYRARDSRLGRDVAIKVLPGHLAGDIGFRERFEHEARAVARLNHPNILALHDVGEAGGVRFIVTELIDGEPARGPLPLRKLLDVAAQIADGLAAAHDAGLVHRDIKPDNLLVTRDGRVKILDFGLASERLLSDEGPGVTRVATSPGTVLGTVTYMSPEQARGAVVDARSDQFSFGLVLYELVSGRQAFARDSAVQTLSAIIEAEPDMAPLGAVPVQVRWIIERCLAKDPADRYASTADLYRDLRHLRDRQSELGRSGVQDIAAPPAKRRRAWIAVAVIAAVVAGSAAGTAFMWSRVDRPASLDAYRFVPFAVDAGVESMPAWSPDGQALAYSGEVDGYYQIFTRRLDQSTASQLTKLEGDCLYAAWDPAGTKVFFQLAESGHHGYDANASEIWVVSAAGGAPERLITGSPAFTVAPGGNSLVFLAPRAGGTGDDTYVLREFDLRNRTTRDLMPSPGKWGGGYSPSSRELKFSPDGSTLGLLAQDTASVILVPNPIAHPGGTPRTVRFVPPAGGVVSLYEFDWMPDSRHVVLVLRDKGGDQSLWTGDLERGTLARLTASSQWESMPAVAPDGARVAFSSTPLDWDLLEIDLTSGVTRPLIASARYDGWGDWMPDGSGLVFSTQRTGRFEIWAQTFRDGVAHAVVTPDAFPGEPSLFLVQGAVSPDGRSLAYVRFTPSGTRIYVSALAGSRPVALTADGTSGDREDGPRWSPDGRWIVFRHGKIVMKALASGGTIPTAIASDALDSSRTSDSGVAQWLPDGSVIYAATDGLRQIPPDGGSSRLVSREQPIVWNVSPDGRVVYSLMERDRRMLDLVTLDVATGAIRTLQPLARKPLTPDYNGYWDTVRALRVSPDGKRIMYARLNPTADIWILDGIDGRTQPHR